MGKHSVKTTGIQKKKLFCGNYNRKNISSKNVETDTGKFSKHLKAHENIFSLPLGVLEEFTTLILNLIYEIYLSQFITAYC